MSMHVMMILHGILIMVIHPMLLPLVDEFTPEVTTIWRLLLLSLICLACTKTKMLQYSLLDKRSYFTAFIHFKAHCCCSMRGILLVSPCMMFWFIKDILLVLWFLVVSKSLVYYCNSCVMFSFRRFFWLLALHALWEIRQVEDFKSKRWKSIVHGLLFTFIVHGTVHFEILPI